MDAFLLKIIRFLLRHSAAVIVLTAVLTIFAIFLLPKIRVDNSVDVFFDRQSRNYLDFQAWKEQFGSDQVVFIAFQDKDIFTAENLRLISRLTIRLESLADVAKVTSLTSVNDVIGRDEDFIVEPLIAAIPSSAPELEALKKRALANPLYVKNIVSADGTATAIILEIEHKISSDDRYKKTLIEDVDKILSAEFPPGKKYYVSGFTAIEVAYALYMQKDLATFLPLMFLILIVILILSLRNLAGVMLTLLVTVISLVWTMAFLYLCRYSINNVTTIVPPVMLSVTLLESIHVVWEITLSSRGRPLDDILRNQDLFLAEKMRHLFWPCFFTNITTVVGFLSLLVCRVPPIRQLGLVAGAGVFFAFVITFTFMPAAIRQFRLLRHLCRPPPGAPAPETDVYGFAFLRDKPDRILQAIARFSIRHKTRILLASALLILLSLWGTSKIRTETSVIEYFKKNSPIHRSARFVEDHISGIHLLNVSLQAYTDDYFKDPAALKEIEEIQEFLHTIPEADKITSVVDYLKEINRSFHNEDPRFYLIPDSRNLVSQYALSYGADDLDDFVDPQWRWATIRVRLKEHSTVRLQRIIARIDNHLHQRGALKAEKTIVGQTVLEVDANQAVTSGQVQSLTLAMLVIFGMMFVLFRSISLGVLSIFPNVLPLLINFGIMGLLAIRLDSATSMISDIGLGIIVDDTIHFFHSFGEAFRETGDYESSVCKSFAAKGRPTLITSLILILGFGVVSFSRFVPTCYFGILSATLIFNGLWVELFLTPALLTYFRPKPRPHRVRSSWLPSPAGKPETR